MKFNKIYPALVICIIAFGCQNNKQQTTAADPGIFKDTSPIPDKDPRTKEETHFLDKVKAESDYEITSDAIKKDTHIEAFNKYALDSLKNITNWEMIVTDINDNYASSNSVIAKLGNGSPVYNLVLTSLIKIDKSVDSVAIDNRVDFTYTIPKSPKGDALKKQLAVIKTLSKGDVILVSGALLHLDDNGKVNFASFYSTYGGPWNVDLLLTDVSKSKVNNYKYLNKF
jgi:hypothetical protein